MGLAKFGDLRISDHQASSQFKCIQFMVALNRKRRHDSPTDFCNTPGIEKNQEIDSNLRFDVEVRLGKPELELYK